MATMGKAAAATKGLASSTVDMGAKHKQSFNTLGTGAAVMGGAMLLGFGAAAKASMGFDKAMSGVKAVSGATSAEMKKLGDAALKAGADTVFSASEAAQGQAELAKAGVSTAEILGGALAGSLDLAAAGQIDVAKSAEISAQAMNIFGLKGKDVSHIADVLASSANTSASDVTGLGDSLKQGGLVASQYGLSLEETVGTLSAFADSALVGSDAGTSLKTMLQRLTPQSEKAAGVMEEIGFTAFDASGGLKSIDQIAGNLQTSLAGMTDEQRNSTLAILFGSDAVRGATVLYEQGAAGIGKYVKGVNDQGAASRMAGTQLDNLSGDLEALKGSLETALIKGGSAATGALRGMAQGATSVVNAYSNLPAPLQATATAFAGIGGAAALLGGGMLILLPKIAATKQAITELSTSMPRLSSAMGSVKGALVPMAGVLGVATAAYVAYRSTQDQNTESAKKLAAATLEGGSAAAEAARVVAALTSIQQAGGDGSKEYHAIQKMGADASKVGSKALKEYNEQLVLQREAAGPAGRAQMDLNTAMRTYSDLLQTGTASESELAVAEAAVVAAKRNVVVVTDKVTEATNKGAAAAGAAKQPVVELTEAQKALNTSLLGFVDPMGAYTTVLGTKEAAEQKTAEATAAATKTTTDSWEDFAKDVKVSMADYLGELEKQVKAQTNWKTNMLRLAGRVSAGTLDELARMGPEGAPLVAKLASASRPELAKFERLMRSKTASATAGSRKVIEEWAALSPKIARIAGQQTADGYTRRLAAGTITVQQIVAKYKGKLDALPTEKKTKLTAIAEGAIRDAKRLRSAINDIPTRKSVNIRTSASYFAPGQRDNTIGRATGGAVFGAGTGTSDSVPAWLSTGEHVWTAREVQRAGGHRAVEAMRRQVAGYAAGGAVGFPSSYTGTATEVARRIRQFQQASQADLLAKTAALLTPAGGSVGGAGVTRWASLVASVLGELGQSPALTNWVLKLIQHESGGNPGAANNWDINARRGDPSRGLMQTIGSTFAAYAGPYRSAGIFDPRANIYAGLNYGISRYGGVASIPGIRALMAGGAYRPYASGGRVTGRGTGTSDDVRALLSPGEHVWTANEVRRAGGHGVVEGMRGFAAGGRVGMAAGGAVPPSFVSVDTVFSAMMTRLEAAAQASAERAADRWNRAHPQARTPRDAADFMLTPKVDDQRFQASLSKSLRVQRRWQYDLRRIAKRGGQDVAEALAAMGESGVPLVRKFADASTREIRKLGMTLRGLGVIAAQVPSAFAAFQTATARSAVDTRQFNADLLKLTRRGQGGLALALSAMGEEGHAIARGAVGKSSAKLAVLGRQVLAEKQAKETAAALPAVLQLIAILQAGKGAAGIKALVDGSGMSIPDVIGLVTKHKTMLGSAGPKNLAQLNRDLRALNQGRQPKGYALGGVAAEGELYRFAERGTGGELNVPLKGISASRAASLGRVIDRAYGLRQGGTVVNYTASIVVNASPGMDAAAVGDVVERRLEQSMRRVRQHTNAGVRG